MVGFFLEILYKYTVNYALKGISFCFYFVMHFLSLIHFSTLLSLFIDCVSTIGVIWSFLFFAWWIDKPKKTKLNEIQNQLHTLNLKYDFFTSNIMTKMIVESSSIVSNDLTMFDLTKIEMRYLHFDWKKKLIKMNIMLYTWHMWHPHGIRSFFFKIFMLTNDDTQD